MADQSAVLPGYSPFTVARQSTPYLRTPGAQGLVEGASGGQQVADTPTQQFYGDHSIGSAPPSNVAQPAAQWSVFGGSGGAPSSLAGPSAGAGSGFMSVPNVVNALQR